MLPNFFLRFHSFSDLAVNWVIVQKMNYSLLFLLFKLALPLLVQAICLHPDGAVRDKLLRTLFNLFTDSPEAESSMVEMKRTVAILRQCRDLATCLGMYTLGFLMKVLSTSFIEQKGCSK